MSQENKQKSLRLHFTDDEAPEPAMGKPENKPKKAPVRPDKAKGKAPTEKVPALERATDAQAGKTVARLHLGEIPKPKPSDKLMASLPRAPVKLLHQQGDRQDGSENDGGVGNVGVEAASGAGRLGERVFQEGRHGSQRAQKLRPHRQTEAAEKRPNQASSGHSRTMVTKTSSHKTPQGKAPNASNPISRWRQRRAATQQYAARRAQSAGASAGARTTEKVGEKVARSFRKNKKSLVTGGLIFLMFAMVMNAMSSCSPLVQSAFQATVVSTYPADDADMRAAERIYAQAERDMQNYLNRYKQYHDYDEYHFDVDELWHDPHALMAIISAWHNGAAWTVDEVHGTLIMLFNKQYKLIETVEVETRYREEERIGTGTRINEETGEVESYTYKYYVDVPYDYYICYVTLINDVLSHQPVYFMSEQQLGMYAMYMATLGNKPDLFRGNRYASQLKDPLLYDIPPSALEGAAFAALIEEAEKYLGYPYVWGGKSPTTSFDCSGFVSWVFTQSGVLNVGSLGVTSLYGLCTPITPEEARPGDLIFFEGTINRHEGLSHVGIYVGNGMMIHCGNPITYERLSTSHHLNNHFFGFGRPRLR